MIAALVIALLVGVSSAIPSCSDVQNIILEVMEKEKVEATEAILNNYESKLTFEYLGDLRKASYSNFMVDPEKNEKLPKLSIGTETYELFGFVYGPVEKNDGESAAALSFSFNLGGRDAQTIFIPLIFAEDENEEGFDADLNENLSKLLALTSFPANSIEAEISIAWLQKLLSNSLVKLSASEESENTGLYIADCGVVGKSLKPSS